MSKIKTSKFLKATTAAAVAASAVAVPAVTEASTFKDIKPGYQFYDAITELANRDVISGFPEDGTFRPDSHLTRGQAAKIIAGALGLDTTNVVNPGFTDIPTSHQYYGPIAALAQAGIITGYEDNTYRQSEKIQRNHVAKIIAGAFRLTAKNPEDLLFTDVRADYKNDIAALFENGVTTGKTSTTFQGSANVTRGQITAFIFRAEQATKASDDVVVQGNTITFTVGSYENNTIVIGENSYTYADSVRPIFTQANKASLAGASLTVTVADGAIKSVKNITLNKSGFASKPSVFAAGNATIETLTVNSNYVSVKNLKVTGNTTVTNKATDKVEFTNVAVTGNIIVDNKGAVASTNNKYAQDEKGVEVVINNTTATNIIIRALATLTGKANPALVTVEGPIKVTISIEGKIATLTVTDASAGVTLGLLVTVATLNLPTGTKAVDIIVNFAAVEKVVVGGTTSGGSSGGSGGSNTTSKPKPKPPVTTSDTGVIATTEDIAKLTTKIEEANNTLSTFSDGTHKTALLNALTAAQNIATKANATAKEIADALNNLSTAIENALVAEQNLTSDFVITTTDSVELEVEALSYWTTYDFAEILTFDLDYHLDAGYRRTLKETFTSADVTLIYLDGRRFKFTVTNGKFFEKGDEIFVRFYVVTQDGEKKLHETRFDYLIHSLEDGSVLWEGWKLYGDGFIEDTY